MAEQPERLNTPGRQRTWLPKVKFSEDAFGAFAEAFARFMGTARFLIWMTIFIVVWLVYNAVAPENARIDPFPFIFLTLVLSLQASYAAPLILLAQNRQDQRDRVTAEQDRQRAERNLADTEYLAREIAALRIAMNDVATRDYVRNEIRDMLAEILERDEEREQRLLGALAGDGDQPPAGQADTDGEA